MQRRLAWLVLGLVTVPPALVFSWGLLGFHGAFFWDGRVYRCGIEAMLATGFPYRYVGECIGYGLPFTSPPGVTKVLSWLAGNVGVTSLAVAYGLLYVAGIAALIWSARRLGAGITESLAFLVLASCGIFVSELASGNTGVVFIGLFCASLLMMERHPWWPVILCVLVAPFKAHYALFLLVPLLVNRHFLSVAAGLCAISLWFMADAMMDAGTFRHWLGVATSHADEVPGFGFMMVMGWLGLGQSGWIAQGLSYALWGGVLLGLAWHLTSRMEAPVDRAMVALACVTLMLPRLKEYDCLVIVPLYFWLTARLPSSLQDRMRMGVLGIGFFLPAAWWWLRKTGLLVGQQPWTWNALIDMKWLVQTQGLFLTGALIVLLGFIVAGRPGGTGTR